MKKQEDSQIANSQQESSRLWIYAIIDSNDTTNASLKELEGISPVYNIPYKDIGAVAGNFYEGQIHDMKDYVLKHEEIVEKLMEYFTVLPMKFQTVLMKRENVLSMMEEYYSDFKENLCRLRNKVEFGIKALWLPDKIKGYVISASCKKRGGGTKITGSSPAKRFMKKKFEEYRTEKAFNEEAEKHITVIDNYFKELVVEKRLRRLQTEKLLLNASYLIEKRRENDFRQAFNRLKCSHDDLEYQLSGPWPPYNFIVLRERGHGLLNKL